MSKKFLAIVLAATMVVGSTVTAFASDTTSGGTGTKLADYGTTAIDGTGSAEGLVNTHLYRVVLPVIPASSLNYTIDPQGLVKETAGKKYGEGVTVGDGNVFFKNHETLNATTEGTITGVSGETDKFTVENKSTFPITVTVKTKATAATGTGNNLVVGLASSATLDPDEQEIYLAYKDNAKNAEDDVVLTTSDQEIATVLGDASAAYKYDYASNAYSYAFDSEGTYEFAKLEFQYVAKVDTTDVAGWTVKTGATAAADEVRYDEIKAPTISVLYKLDEYTVAADDDDYEIDVAGPTGASEAAEPTPVTSSWDSTNKLYKINLAEAVTEVSDITNLKVNGNAVTVAIELNTNKNVARITKTNLKNAMGTNWPAEATDDLVITFKVGTVDYTTTIARN